MAMTDDEVPDFLPREWIDEPAGRIDWEGAAVVASVIFGLTLAVVIVVIILFG
jgi:hypothetical protein